MTAIEEMLSKYNDCNEDQYIQAFKEIMQEIVLCGLARGGFFESAAFTGGTALRILHGIGRFSEDLDFSLLKTNKDFSFEKYFPYIRNELIANGFDIEFGKVNEASTVKSAFIKADTYKLILNFLATDPEKMGILKNGKIKVKLEVDTNPPEGSNYEEKTKILPSPHVIKALDLSSMFALKCHAIMCRNYIKGRDYFDYLWFIEHNTPINEQLLNKALFQTEGKDYSQPEIIDKLKKVFNNVDIKEVKSDVRRFLDLPETLEKWSNDVFVNSINELQFVNCLDNIHVRRRKGR